MQPSGCAARGMEWNIYVNIYDIYIYILYVIHNTSLSLYIYIYIHMYICIIYYHIITVILYNMM